MATSEQRQEAFNRGQQFGQHAMAARGQRAVTHAMLTQGLGAFAADPDIRAAFEQGFGAGYPAPGGHGMASSGAELPPEEAQRRGWEAGEQAALGKQARIPGNWYGQLGPDQGDAGQRQRFDQGFYGGYDKAAAGLGVVGPGGQTATSVLKKVTADEQKKASDPFGAQQRELQFAYDTFDNQINSDLSAYAKVDGGMAFLSDWKLAKAEFTVRNMRQMSESEIADSQSKLDDLKSRQQALVAAATVKMSIPGITDIFTKPPVVQPQPGKQQPVPAKPGGTPAAGAGLFGLSRNATIGLGLIALSAIGGGIYYATRDEEHEGMVKGPDGVWRPKPRVPVLPPAPR